MNTALYRISSYLSFYWVVLVKSQNSGYPVTKLCPYVVFKLGCTSIPRVDTCSTPFHPTRSAHPTGCDSCLLLLRLSPTMSPSPTPVPSLSPNQFPFGPTRSRHNVLRDRVLPISDRRPDLLKSCFLHGPLQRGVIPFPVPPSPWLSPRDPSCGPHA